MLHAIGIYYPPKPRILSLFLRILMANLKFRDTRSLEKNLLLQIANEESKSTFGTTGDVSDMVRC